MVKSIKKLKEKVGKHVDSYKEYVKGKKELQERKIEIEEIEPTEQNIEDLLKEKDTKQGLIGDCWLINATAAYLNTNSEKIKETLKDNIKVLRIESKIVGRKIRYPMTEYGERIQIYKYETNVMPNKFYLKNIVKYSQDLQQELLKSSSTTASLIIKFIVKSLYNLLTPVIIPVQGPDFVKVMEVCYAKYKNGGNANNKLDLTLGHSSNAIQEIFGKNKKTFATTRNYNKTHTLLDNLLVNDPLLQKHVIFLCATPDILHILMKSVSMQKIMKKVSPEIDVNKVLYGGRKDAFHLALGILMSHTRHIKKLYEEDGVPMAIVINPRDTSKELVYTFDELIKRYLYISIMAVHE